MSNYVYHMKDSKLRLRPFRRNDAKDIVTWTSEPEEFYKWSAGILGEYPVTEERMLEATSGRDFNEGYFPFVAFDEDGLVGFFTLRVPGDDNRTLRFGYVILAPSKRGRGYGKEMLSLGLKFAFDVYGADTVSLGVFDNNAQAYNCYSGLGFCENGTRIEYDIYGNNWVDIEMEIKRTGR